LRPTQTPAELAVGAAGRLALFADNAPFKVEARITTARAERLVRVLDRRRQFATTVAAPMA